MEGPLHPLSHKEEIVKLLPQIKRQLKNRGNRGKTGETEEYRGIKQGTRLNVTY